MGEAGARKGVRTTRVQRVRDLGQRRARFIDHLGIHCNVQAAAAAAGVRRDTVYRWRTTDAAFADAWADALAAGYEMLEMRLIAHALAGTGDADGDGGAEMPPLDTDLAMKLLGMHRQARGKPGGREPMRFATREETDRVLLARLAAIEQRRAAAQAAAQAAAEIVGAGGDEVGEG